jgi:hypothetical protein
MPPRWNAAALPKEGDQVMDRPRLRRPSRGLRPNLDGLERKALLSADQAAIVSTATTTEPPDVAPTPVHLDRTTVPTSPSTAPDLVALAASPVPADRGAIVPTSTSPDLAAPDLAARDLAALAMSSGPSDPGPTLPTWTSTSTDPYVLAASSGGTSIPTDQIALDGNIRGFLRHRPGATTGAEPAFTLAGKGRHATIGRARVDGFAMPSNVESLPSAAVTLKTSKGSITLALTGLPETSARPALAYRYTVQSGTGAYVGVTCSGTAQLGLPKGLPRSATGSAPFTLMLQSDHIRS